MRAREAREKQEKERADRAAKKRALVDFNAPDDQEGVMDSLLEALKTGSAFNREQKRKRAPRAAGGEMFCEGGLDGLARLTCFTWLGRKLS